MSILGHSAPPQRIEALLQSLGADPDFADDVLGDLAEEFSLRCRWDGAPAARRWYYREALRTAPHLLRDWRRRFRLADAIPLLWAVMAGFATDAVLVSVLFRATFWATGIPLSAYVHHWKTTGDLMPWLALVLAVRQIVPSMTVGFVAGATTKRAAVPCTLLLASSILAAPVASALLSSVPMRTFGMILVVNGVLAASCVTGGMAATFWMRRKPARP